MTGTNHVTPEARLAQLVSAFGAAADADRAVAMAKYMKGHFAFFGVPTPARRAIQRTALGRWTPTDTELVDFVDAAWSRPERELQYAACDVAVRGARRSEPALIEPLERWITTKSWWDSVDAMAHAVGDLVAAYPNLSTVMDAWIDADDFWLARVAILHQLRYRTTTDAKRLFAYCAQRASDREFFVRKAIGWALREYAKTDPDAVRTFVAEHAADLSTLSQREALRRLT